MVRCQFLQRPRVIVVLEEVCEGLEIISSIYPELSALVDEPIIEENRVKRIYLQC
jgi:hypothetical protein